MLINANFDGYGIVFVTINDQTPTRVVGLLYGVSCRAIIKLTIEKFVTGYLSQQTASSFAWP